MRRLSIATALLLGACSLSDTTKTPSVAAPGAAERSRAEPDWVGFSTGTSTVKSLAIQDDLLWIGLTDGLIRYDTRTDNVHEAYTPASTKGGLMAKGIYVIGVDGKGTKWIGTYGGGLTRFDGQMWRTFTVADGLADAWVYDVVFDPQGKMWVATWKGVSVFDNGAVVKNYTEADGLADKWVYAIARDRQGIFWFGTESGVSRFDGTRFTTYTHKDGLGAEIANAPPPSNEALSALPSSTPGAGGGYSSDEVMQHHMKAGKTNIGPNPNFVISAVTDRDDAKWFGTWGAGISRFDGKTWKTYTQNDGLGGNYIQRVTIDADGRIWAGTNGGASWYENGRWRTLTRKDGLIDDNVFAIAFDPKGRRWFGTYKGLSMFKGRLPS